MALMSRDLHEKRAELRRAQAWLVQTGEEEVGKVAVDGEVELRAERPWRPQDLESRAPWLPWREGVGSRRELWR